MTLRDAEDRLHALLDSHEPFLAWLDSLAPDAQVGLPMTADACPIAKYLRAHDIAWPQVYPTVVTAEADGEMVEVTMPGWAESFINRVDLEEGADQPVTISRNRAIGVLLKVLHP